MSVLGWHLRMATASDDGDFGLPSLGRLRQTVAISAVASRSGDAGSRPEQPAVLRTRLVLNRERRPAKPALFARNQIDTTEDERNMPVSALPVGVIT
jgi:hypothetical protein